MMTEGCMHDQFLVSGGGGGECLVVTDHASVAASGGVILWSAGGHAPQAEKASTW